MGSKKSFIEHGGDIYTEGRFKGIELLDFSSNINFLGVPKSFSLSLHKAVENLICYPDLKYREAKGHIKEYLKQGIREENIILGNGAAEIISLALGALRKPCIVVPSFSEYETAAKNYSKRVVFSYLKEDLSIDYEDIMQKLEGCGGLVIGNPNNPNGGVIDKKLFEEIMDYCEEHNKKIVIDEAFIEFAEEAELSFIDKCMSYKCLFIIRALTKFFAMPGIRFGYGICSDIDFLENLSKRQAPWNINTFAEAAVKSILRDEEYITVSKAAVKKEREYFSESLHRFEFVEKVYGSCANFLLVKLKGVSGEKLYHYCLSQRVLIRRCRNFRGLDDSFIRVAVKSREDNNKLLRILKDYKEGLA